MIKNEKDFKCVIGAGYLTGKQTVILNEMCDFVDICLNAKIDFAQFRPFHYDFTSIDNEMAEIIDRYKDREMPIISSVQKYGNFNFRDSGGFAKCYGVYFSTVIGADANVYICCHMRGRKEFTLGNLRKDSFRDVWANREKTFSKIDTRKCVPLCRCCQINKDFIWLLKMKLSQHVNFL